MILVILCWMSDGFYWAVLMMSVWVRLAVCPLRFGLSVLFFILRGFLLGCFLSYLETFITIIHSQPAYTCIYLYILPQHNECILIKKQTKTKAKETLNIISIPQLHTPCLQFPFPKQIDQFYYNTELQLQETKKIIQQNMQGQDQNITQLYKNIREARIHLQQLKQQANALEADPYNFGNHNVKDYIKNAAYSLSKNDHIVDKKIAQYKARLPSIHKQDKDKDKDKTQLDASVLAGYKKYKKTYKQQPVKRNSEQSTKIQNSFSFSVQNRPMKIHSNHQRNIKPEYSHIQAASQSNIVLPPQFLKLKQQTERVGKQGGLPKRQVIFSNNRRNFSSQKKKIKYIDLNSSASGLKDDDVLKPPAQVEYSSIVDRYSKHEFMIINGKVANEGPEFASYNRIYESIFGRIRQQIGRLEDMLAQKRVNFARFDGKKLAYLCLKEQIKKSQLVDCLVDENGTLKGLLIPASKYTGKKGKDLAATKIQSNFRMHLTRQKYLLLKKKTIVIQRFFRKNLLRLQLQRKIHERNSQILQKFESRQDDLVEKWKGIRKKKRIQIHLNSIEADQQKRLSIQNFTQRQNIQLSRIFRLRDQNLILIYVSSAELSPQLINYYYKMLELAAIPKYEDRLLFFTPSNASRFPQHFSVSKLLYYSSKTLKQLKIITEDLPTLLFPGHPSNQLIKICDFLDCYLFSGAPQKIKPFTTRSQALSFMKNLSIPCLPSAMEMYDYGQFLNTFSVLIIKNPQVKTWVLKIDDQFGGRGIAYLDVGKSKIIQSLLNKVDYGSNTNQFFATDIGDVISQPANQEITIKIRDYLRENLPQRLVVATPTVYRCYSQYMGRFIKKGGTIQAKPNTNNRQSLSYPCISFCVDPLGEFQIISSYDKIIGSPYRAFACSFPQKSIDIKQATSIIRQICQSFKIRKIFGHFTIDFIALTESQTGSRSKISSKPDININKQTKIWVLDIDPYINNYTASFYLFDALMGGSYFPEKNIYLTQKQDDKAQTFSLDTMSSEANQQNINNLVQRNYIFVPHFFNQNMFKIKIKQFFKQARIQRFNFDIGNKEGLCIMLLDSLTSGTMSMMAVTKYEQQAISLLKNVLQFIVKMSDVKNVTYGKTDSEPSTDRILIKDMLNLFMTMVRKDQKTNAKFKAIKQFQNSQNLEFIM